MADEHAAAGLAHEQDVDMVRAADDVVATAVVLSFEAPEPALVGNERYGWRTAASRRHPTGRETGQPPEGGSAIWVRIGDQPVMACSLPSMTAGVERAGRRRITRHTAHSLPAGPAVRLP